MDTGADMDAQGLAELTVALLIAVVLAGANALMTW
jgi:hypothetical protein